MIFKREDSEKELPAEPVEVSRVQWYIIYFGGRDASTGSA
jgi:hypothetical protein